MIGLGWVKIKNSGIQVLVIEIPVFWLGWTSKPVETTILPIIETNNQTVTDPITVTDDNKISFDGVDLVRLSYSGSPMRYSSEKTLNEIACLNSFPLFIPTLNFESQI